MYHYTRSQIFTPFLSYFVQKQKTALQEAKFINFLGNSMRIHNPGLCKRVWAAISEETEKMKKEAEEEKKTLEAAKAAAKEEEKKTEEKKNGAVVPEIEENGNEASEVAFKWKKAIKRKLKEAGGEMKVKQLRRAVIADYEEAGGAAETATDLFEEKLQKAGISLNGKIAQLA